MKAFNVSKILLLIVYLCSWCLLVEAVPYPNYPVNHPDLYLRFRKNAASNQDSVQPFIRFRKSLPLRLRILERQPELNQPYSSEDGISI